MQAMWMENHEAAGTVDRARVQALLDHLEEHGALEAAEQAIDAAPGSGKVLTPDQVAAHLAPFLA